MCWWESFVLHCVSTNHSEQIQGTFSSWTKRKAWKPQWFLMLFCVCMCVLFHVNVYWFFFWKSIIYGWKFDRNCKKIKQREKKPPNSNHKDSNHSHFGVFTLFCFVSVNFFKYCDKDNLFDSKVFTLSKKYQYLIYKWIIKASNISFPWDWTYTHAPWETAKNLPSCYKVKRVLYSRNLGRRNAGKECLLRLPTSSSSASYWA